MEVLPAPDGAVMMMILLLIAMCKEKEFSRRLRRWTQMKFGHTCPDEFVQAGIIQMDTDELSATNCTNEHEGHL